MSMLAKDEDSTVVGVPNQQDRKQSLSSIQDSFTNISIDPANQLLSLAHSLPINISTLATSPPSRLLSSSSSSLTSHSFGKRRPSVNPYPIPRSSNPSKSPPSETVLSPLLSPKSAGTQLPQTKAAGAAPSQSGTHKGKWVCESCGKIYKHPNCLGKHKWEHTEAWKETNKLSISKHQQVQLLEAASVLVGLHGVSPTSMECVPPPSSGLSSAGLTSPLQGMTLSSALSPTLRNAPDPLSPHQEFDDVSEQSQVDVFGVDWSKIN
ncbi:hypothetical protein HDV03_000703 [Kappamyces sp. JEL0829]|nr:hypothetical protein HDV03_000703 [Kappamyces sp. JEL0829]